MGGPGVQRSTRFVQYLRDFNYDPLVLTIKEEDVIQMKSNYDPSLLEYLPNDLKIVRVDSAQNFKLNRVLNKLRIYRLFWFFLYPMFWEKSAMWPYKSFKKAKQLVLENGIQLVYTSSGPFSSLLLGKKLKESLKIQWVADMRDPYTDAYAWSYPSKWHWFLSRAMEKKMLNACDHLIVNTDEVKKLYLDRGILSDSKITVINNGF
jgi:hypothetical protein